MNQASDMLVVQILTSLEKNLPFLKKNLQIDNFLYSIKKQSKQNKELKYRRKDIVCLLVNYDRTFTQTQLADSRKDLQNYMIYPLHGRNTKKLKNKKQKLLIFFVNTRILVKLFQKKPK